MRPSTFLALILGIFLASPAAYTSTNVLETTSGTVTETLTEAVAENDLPIENLPIPDNFSAEYVLQSGIFDIGITKRTLSLQEDGRYIFTSLTHPTGMFAVFFKGKVTERSIWEYHKGRARPILYYYKDTSKKKKRDVNLAFDWEKKTVTNTINGEPWDMEITPDTQDKLIYQINIMLNLLENRDLKTMKINVADGGKLKSYDAIIQQKETIKTPAGKFDTIRVNRDDGKRVTTLWCAPSLNYLPVRIEHYKKGDAKVNAYLVKVNGL